MTVCLILMMATTAFAGVTEEWVAEYNGTGNSGDSAEDIIIDSSGNVYVTGNSVGNGTGNDYATVAYDPSGNELWAARYNGPGNADDIVRAIATDSAGNVYVTGSSYGSGTDNDYATVAYDSSGNQLWVARYNGPGNSYDVAIAIATDSAGNVYVTGWSYTPWTAFDYATVAYDSSGNQLWAARYHNYHDDFPAAIATDSAGNVYVTGMSQAATPDIATVAYDSSGNQLWAARYNGPGNGYDRATAIATDSAGNVYVTGWSWSATIIDYATVAYDSSGNQLWVASYNGPENYHDYANAIATDDAGNVYVSGESQHDYATVAYDSSGNELWVARYNGTRNSFDKAYAIATDSAGNVYVTGESQGDYATVAYDSSGNELWVARYNGQGNGSDQANSIALDSAGNVYVTGYSVGNGTGNDFATVKYSYVNLPPVANAGADQTVECAGFLVTLDGSGSTDPDGHALTYTWTGAFGNATGVNPTVTLPLGTTAITLTVHDVEGESSIDTVNVTVEDTTPPATSALISGTQGNGSWFITPVTIDLSSTDSCSGIATLNYNVDGTPYSVAGSTASILLNDGNHTVTFYADDTIGNTETQKQTTADVDATPPAITILGITDAAVYDIDNVPVASFSVTDASSGVSTSNDTLTGGDVNGMGVYTYDVSATDVAGQNAQTTATYTVIASPAWLKLYIDQLVIDGLVKGSIENKLDNVLDDAIAAATPAEKIAALQEFIVEVQDNTPKKIDPSVEPVLVGFAQDMIANP
jgi:hypothetical protein